jgi:SAM-dependent methyltransferase
MMRESQGATRFGKLSYWLSIVRQTVHVPLDLLERNVSVRSAAVKVWAKTIEPGATLVDIGAGDCKYAPLFAHCKYVPQDLPDANFSPSPVPLLCSDITEIPLPAGSVDAILCTEVLEHVERPLDALSQFARLLKPGGRLFLSVPAACRVHRVPTHFYGGFAPDFFERSFPNNGLRLDRLQPVGNWSQFMAQEIGRMPSVVREHTRMPRPLAAAVAVALWPTFRLVLPSALLAFSSLDRSEDLPLGWIAYATRS